MKKIMFNDKYGLTEAVLECRKTQTRRIISTNLYNAVDWKAFEEGNHDCIIDPENPYNTDIRNYARYMIGEEVAIAQSYKDSGYTEDLYQTTFLRKPTIIKSIDSLPLQGLVDVPFNELKGWNNKMFVRAELMIHHIKITDVRVERLHDISDEDCLNEGIRTDGYLQKYYTVSGFKKHFSTPKEAFAALIDKVGQKGDWVKNPYVFVYEFELVR